ncbi:hypothetical protein EWM60_14275, partial [Candidatus Erwinia dacicola]|nr:hypothetical protein [Candidatus Erwinia dacicola]
LLGAVLTKQNEEWLLQNCYLPQHTMAEIDQTAEDDVIDALPQSRWVVTTAAATSRIFSSGR